MINLFGWYSLSRQADHSKCWVAILLIPVKFTMRRRLKIGISEPGIWVFSISETIKTVSTVVLMVSPLKDLYWACLGYPILTDDDERWATPNDVIWSNIKSEVMGADNLTVLGLPSKADWSGTLSMSRKPGWTGRLSCPRASNLA